MRRPTLTVLAEKIRCQIRALVPVMAPAELIGDYEKAYFNGDADPGVHKELIEDLVRTNMYEMAIMHHQDFIRRRVLLDLGCDTGIFSLICARQGARMVYAVEASRMGLLVNNIVAENNFSHLIKVHNGQSEDVVMDENVDIIISEWRGYMLLHENMLESVIRTRDLCLNVGGLMLPSRARLYMAPFTHTKRFNDNVAFWHNVRVFNMSSLITSSISYAFKEPFVETITDDNVLTHPRSDG